MVISREGGVEAAVRARVGAAWFKWREVSGVINDKRIPRRLKVKIYKTVIRPVLLYGAETWALHKKEDTILEVTEMRMLRRIRGVTLRDRMRNIQVREDLGVVNILQKVREARIRWYGHLVRMDERSTYEIVWSPCKNG